MEMLLYTFGAGLFLLTLLSYFYRITIVLYLSFCRNTETTVLGFGLLSEPAFSLGSLQSATPPPLHISLCQPIIVAKRKIMFERLSDLTKGTTYC